MEWERLEISSRKFGAIKGTFHASMGMIHAETVRTYQKQKRLRSSGKNTQKHYTKKVHLVKAIVFPVVMNGCESWTIKKPEC